MRKDARVIVSSLSDIHYLKGMQPHTYSFTFHNADEFIKG